MAINGNTYDWESISIVGPQGTFVDVQEISYSDERPIEGTYGKGSIAQGFGRKNYKASGSLTILRTEFEALRDALGGSVYTRAPCQIVVSFANDDQPTTVDTLSGVMITKTDLSAKQGDEKTEIKLDLSILSPIAWGGVPAYSDAGATGI